MRNCGIAEKVADVVVLIGPAFAPGFDLAVRSSGGRVDCFAIAWRLTWRPYGEKSKAKT
jgi:hypothetical protein